MKIKHYSNRNTFSRFLGYLVKKYSNDIAFKEINFKSEYPIFCNGQNIESQIEEPSKDLLILIDNNKLREEARNIIN